MPPGLTEAAALRSRFFVRGWLGAMVASLVAALLYAAAGIWPQVIASTAVLLSGLPLLWLHRRGANFVVLANVALVIATAAFGLGTVAQRPADYTTLALLLMTPLLAGFLLGRRAVFPWMIITFVWGGLIITAVDHGWLFDFVDPMPTPSHVLNFGLGVVVVWLFARTYDDLNRGALERLQAADTMRRAFLANISHEIRTPMNGVLGMTEVLLQGPTSREQQEQLQTIQRSGRTLVALINDLLDLSKMEAGKLSVEKADFNLARLLSDVQALAAPQAATRQLELSVWRAPDVPERLNGDGLRLGQVLNNLLSNAVKFTERGAVRLSVMRCGEARYRFSIDDTGVGIKPEVLDSLFKAFQQADSSTTRRYGGSGLGLALSQELVTLMGGHISVQSTPGRGSTFAFELALHDADTLSGEFGAEQQAEQRRRTVLVVDDNPINLKVAVELVRKAGCDAVGAVNGALALAAVSERSFDLVLMDCHMPEMDGFEATERIRALGGDRGRTPIVALTASAMPDEIAACKRVGMNSVLVKPVTFAALKDVLSAA